MTSVYPSYLATCRSHGSPARRCRWPSPGLSTHSDPLSAYSLQPLVKDLIVTRAGHDEVPILGPGEVSDKAAMTHSAAKTAGLGTITLLYAVLYPGM